MISSDDGYITETWAGDSAYGRDFCAKIMNAKVDYPKVSKRCAEEKKRLTAELKALETDKELAQKEKELQKLTKGISEADLKAIQTFEKDLNLAFWMGFAGLFVMIMPVYGCIMPLVGLGAINGPRRLGVKDGRAKAALIMCIIGLVVNLIFTIAMLASIGSSTPPERVDDTQVEEIQVKNYVGIDAKIAYNELVAEGFNVEFAEEMIAKMVILRPLKLYAMHCLKILNLKNMVIHI